MDSDDIGAETLALYNNSPREDHRHLCSAVAAIAQTLADQSIPPSPVAYFAAVASSLQLLSSTPNSGADPVVPALLSFFAKVLGRVPTAVVRSRWDDVANSLVRVVGTGELSAGGVKSGVRCLACLVVVGEKGNWDLVGPLFGVVLQFVCDSRPKVRKESHACLREILASFQKTAALGPASKQITAIFERSLLLAGRKANDSESAGGPRGATEVLYILNALKDCLPVMADKHTDNILKYCKPLLELRQPIVTRNIVELLHALCSSSTSEVSAELLLDLLCSLASSVADKEKSADAMSSVARLLHVGIKKVYGMNKQICAVKLPTIFNSLGDILGSEHNEAVFASTEALKGLISNIVDESLVKPGLDQINNANGGIRKSAPCVIEKICAIVEGLLGYRYNAVWDMSFQVLSAMFTQLGASSCYFMAGALGGMADMQKLPDEDFPFRKQLYECIGSAIGAMGPEKFLSILPLNLDAENVDDTNAWLLPLLKQYVVGAPLVFFSKHILSKARHMRQRSQKFEGEGRLVSARSAEGLVYSLWALLPAFCNYPVDAPTGFKLLHRELCNALRQEPEIRGIICSALQTLIQQNNAILSDASTIPDEEIGYHEQKENYRYTKEEAKENLKAIQSDSAEFLSVLTEVFLSSSNDSGGCLLSTIHELATVLDKKIVKKAFMATMQKLLKVTQEAIKAKQPSNSDSMQVDSSSNEASLSHARAILLDLAVSFLPGLSEKEIDVLFSAIKPALQDEGVVQKKAYKIISIVLKEHDEFLTHNLDELLKLMIATLPACQFSAKRYRLESLYFLIVHVLKDSSEQRKRDIISSFLTEIILALKDANKKTRNRAYDLLVEIGHACEDEEKGGGKETLLQFFNMIAGGIAGETPHMISAAVRGLARLSYEFSDLVSVAYNLLPSSFLLLRRKNREIVKANLGLIKVLVAKSNSESLEAHLKAMVEGLVKWQDDTKNHFKAKIKLLLQLLVRKCGLEAVKTVMPEEHMKLLTNIRKIMERKDRSNSEEDVESHGSRMTSSRHSRWNHTRIFSDFGDDDANDDSDVDIQEGKTFTGRHAKSSRPGSRASSRSIRKRQVDKSLPEDLLDQLEDDPLDLLDHQKMRLALQSSKTLKRKQASDDVAEIDPEGRLVIRADGDRKRKDKKPSVDNYSDSRSRTSSHSKPSTSAGTVKRRKTTDTAWAYTGQEYTSKKASGDIKKKGKLEPYAYWPLDRKLLNRRAERRAIAHKGMASVMKVTKKLEGKSASAALSVNRFNIKTKKKSAKK